MAPTKSSWGMALLALLCLLSFASAHTWVEQLMVIAPNGTLVGQPGFARGNVLRGSPGFNDPTMVNLIPPDGRPINQIQPSDLMCKSSQTSSTQTDGSPRLQAAPGSGIALRYQENGHVTLPDNQPGKPSNRGTVYVYGTTQPSPDDSFLAIHRVWNANATGGDGRGVLLSTQNFDDGQCYQVNGGAISQQRQKQYAHPAESLMGSDLWCQQDIQIPSTAPSGQPYTLYWVWDWPTLPGTAGFPNGKQEIYTTCMDVDVVDNAGLETFSNAAASYLQGQPLDHAAVASELSDIANPTAVTGQSIPFTGIATPPSSVPVPTTTESLTLCGVGSIIAFGASATGPVPGGASEASVSAATETDTGVPAFLSVHTGSTAGPGIETQSFSVIPISITATEASQPQQTNGFGRGGGSFGNGGGDGRGNANAAVATYTEYESVTQTVYQTVYQTRYTKRDGESFSMCDPFPSVSAGASGDGYSTLDGFPPIRVATSTNTASPCPWPTFAPGEPHSVFRGGPYRNHTCGRHGDGGDGSHLSRSAGYTSVGFAPSSTTETLPQVIPVTAETSAQVIPVTTTETSPQVIPVTTIETSPQVIPVTPTVGPLLTLSDGVVLTMPTPGGSIMTMPDGSIMTMPITTDMPNPGTPSPSLSIMSSSAQSAEFTALTMMPAPDSTPAPTAAPVLDPRAAAPAANDCSTAHSIFRLRARNPFVWLGWSNDAQPTAAR